MTSRFDQSSTSPERVVEEVYRAEWGRLLSLLVARTRRLDLVEDALGEAFARASARWPADGVPANPAGWLYTVAYRQVVGRLRAEAVAGRRAPLLAVRPDWAPPDESLGELGDDRLHLILLCCHPALSRESRSALALRMVVGTPTDQIARLFLVPTATMAARITRAKKKILAAGIPLGAPATEELRSRLDEVCRTIYLAFTSGYTPGVGSDLLRVDLASEAVRLATILHDLLPDAPQVRAIRDAFDTDDALGGEKWGLGPTAVALKQRGPWTIGALVNHVQAGVIVDLPVGIDGDLAGHEAVSSGCVRSAPSTRKSSQLSSRRADR